ncbi:MAG TPA: 4-(cytidine 5'-diphospho)-2-C-methyl-D-erythritol kinase [Desulfatirhabdiaceae bacterium]|nr:4-(cytidine 5'-diphospho)-2-C-methyl-D-erythritol kinase [Desulfatirhabdiaceae bacterium]
MTIFSPAKINLFLAVTGKRPDGYHNLITLMCPIALFDEIVLDFNHDRIEVFCNHPDVPKDETNLAARAVTAFCKHLNIQQGVSIQIDKRIPVAAGLGGGSSNAASVLLAMNRYHGNVLPPRVLSEMASTLGSDVPFFIYQKPAIVTGKGDKIEIFNRLSSFSVILICPPISVSTRMVYTNLNLGLTNCEQKLKKLLLNDCHFDPHYGLCNDLETVTVPMHPEIEEIKQMLIQNGALGSLMSGSGPSVFAVFSDDQAAARAYRSVSKGCCFPCYMTRLLV